MTHASNRPVFLAAVTHLCVTALLLAVACRSHGVLAHVGIIAAIAFGLCWGSNTISHIHLHNPLFRHVAVNRLLSLVLSVSLGVPQTWWKRRHLVHHGARADAASAAVTILVAAEFAAIMAAWAGAAVLAPRVFLGVYLPAWLLGLGLCALQGHYEHAGAAAVAGVDYHGRLYNRLWFNDGYHAAHHDDPTTTWTAIRHVVPTVVRVSPWPPLLRWLDARAWRAWASRGAAGVLDRLERASLHVNPVRRLLIATHQRSIKAILGNLDQAGHPAVRRACIIGGGLFPRTALILRALHPEIDLVIVDGRGDHLDCARVIPPSTARTTFVQGFYEARDRSSPLAAAIAGCDLVVIPLAYRGDRTWLYAHPPAPLVIIHDWFWRRRGAFGVAVSPWLLKRMNVVRGPSPSAPSVTLPGETTWPHPQSASIPPLSPLSDAATGRHS